MEEGSIEDSISSVQKSSEEKVDENSTDSKNYEDLEKKPEEDRQAIQLSNGRVFQLPVGISLNLQAAEKPSIVCTKPDPLVYSDTCQIFGSGLRNRTPFFMFLSPFIVKKEHIDHLQSKNEQNQNTHSGHGRNQQRSVHGGNQARPKKRKNRSKINDAQFTISRNDEQSSNEHELQLNSVAPQMTNNLTGHSRQSDKRKSIANPQQSEFNQQKEITENLPNRDCPATLAVDPSPHSTKVRHSRNDNPKLLMNELTREELEFLANTMSTDLLPQIRDYTDANLLFSGNLIPNSRVRRKHNDFPGLVNDNVPPYGQNQMFGQNERSTITVNRKSKPLAGSKRRNAKNTNSALYADNTVNTRHPGNLDQADNCVHGEITGDIRKPSSCSSHDGASSNAYISRQDAIRLNSDLVEIVNQRDTSEPMYVNAKQYERIIKRRQARTKLELEGRIPPHRTKFMHRSRHEHAVKRARSNGGRFAPASKQSSSLDQGAEQVITEREVKIDKCKSNKNQTSVTHKHEKQHRKTVKAKRAILSDATCLFPVASSHQMNISNSFVNDMTVPTPNFANTNSSAVPELNTQGHPNLTTLNSQEQQAVQFNQSACISLEEYQKMMACNQSRLNQMQIGLPMLSSHQQLMMAHSDSQGQTTRHSIPNIGCNMNQTQAMNNNLLATNPYNSSTIVPEVGDPYQYLPIEMILGMTQSCNADETSESMTDHLNLQCTTETGNTINQIDFEPYLDELLGFDYSIESTLYPPRSHGVKVPNSKCEPGDVPNDPEDDENANRHAIAQTDSIINSLNAQRNKRL